MQDICDAIKAQDSKSYHPIYQAGFLQLPTHFNPEDVAASAAATMHPMAASAGAISASVIRSALCQRSSSFSASFSTAGLSADGNSAAAPLDLLMVLQGDGGAPPAAAGKSPMHHRPQACTGALHTIKPTPSSGSMCLKGVLAFSQDVLDPNMMALLAQHFQVCVGCIECFERGGRG